MPLVQLTDASFGYRRRPVVAGVSCALDGGRCLGIYGPNGIGKSTLLRGITGLLRPLAGLVRLQPRIQFGYLPQQRAAESHWPMTALDAASMAVSVRTRFGFVRRQRPRVLQSLAALGVAGLARRPFFNLSGGQQQRVLLAGALAAEPSVLVLDEPMNGIDVSARQSLVGHLRHAKQNGMAILLVSHDVADLLELADSVLLLEPAADVVAPSSARPMSPSAILDRLNRLRVDSTAVQAAREVSA